MTCLEPILTSGPAFCTRSLVFTFTPPLTSPPLSHFPIHFVSADLFFTRLPAHPWSIVFNCVFSCWALLMSVPFHSFLHHDVYNYSTSSPFILVYRVTIGHASCIHTNYNTSEMFLSELQVSRNNKWKYRPKLYNHGAKMSARYKSYKLESSKVIGAQTATTEII